MEIYHHWIFHLFSRHPMMSFRLFGIRVFLSFWTLIPITFSLITAEKGQKIVLLCIISAIIHEVGHLIFICRFRGKPDKISVNLFEVKIVSESSLSTKTQDIFIVSAGVISNFLFAILSYFSGCIFHSIFFWDFALCNLLVGVLNALPFISFDGGQLLIILLSHCFNERIAYIVINLFTLVLIFPLVFAGVYILFVSRHNFSLLFVSIYLLSIFISKELR